MLRIRFSRTGKVGQPSFRIVVAENSAPIKGRYLEIVGNYMPARNPKIVSLKKDRIEYWISKGAVPTDSAAALFKKDGMANMERFISPRIQKRKKKGEEEAAKPSAPAAAPAVAPEAKPA